MSTTMSQGPASDPSGKPPHDPHGHDHHHDHGHGHHHGHGHGHGHEHGGGEHAAVQQSRRLDAMILAVLIGGTLLIGAVIAKFILDWGERADLIAAIAAILLGAPIVYGAAKSLITGRCSHDDGEACGHEHQHHSGSHMEELVALAVMASFANGEYIECGAVAFFMLIASFIEHRTAAGAQQMIESLVRITPTKARKLTDQGEVETAAHDLRPGDRIIVRPGDAVAADGLIRQGASTLNQANITGESLPVEKTEGDEVFAGTINETGVLTVEVSRAGEDSTLGRVQELILQAAASRPAVMRMLEKYASYYTPVVLMVAAILWFFTQDLDASISLLLIACPCAIILAAPTAMVAGLSAAARLGLYVKNVGDLEVARRINAIVLDKTGTLTLGELSVARLAPLDGVEPAELLRAAAAIEHQSRHPVAKAVARTAQKARLQLPEVTGFEEVAGRGVRGIVNGDEILVGRESWIQEQGVDTASLDLSSGEGMSLLVVARNGQPQGWIGLEDRVRAGAKDAMDQLEELGIKRRVMITGDRQSPAKKVAAQLHITDVQAEALPGDKLLLVRQLREKGHTVAVVGDGVNDGPALAAGDVSIAMGAAGSDVAIQSASIALMNNRLNRLPFLVSLSRQTVSVIRQNMIGTMLYIILMLTLLGFGYMTPLVAAIGHGVSSIIVVFNSARLVRHGEEIEEVEHGSGEEEKPQRRLAPQRVSAEAPPAPAAAAV